MSDLTITPAQTLQADRMRFPGMLPREVLIFKNWLRQHEVEYDHFNYNVRIGAGFDPGPSWPENTRRMAIMNTQLRLDAVAYKGSAPTIIEVKDRAGASAVGQLLTYEAVWLHDNPSSPAPALIMVTNRVQDNLAPILAKSGIRLDQVPTDFSALRLKTFSPGYHGRNRGGQ